MTKVPAAYHLVARARFPLTPFEKRDDCAVAWQGLRSAFPQVLAAVLMLNHVHLIVESVMSANKLRRRASLALRSWTRRRRPGVRVWEPVPLPEAIPDDHHLLRQIRYVHLNPCRSGYVKDPLSWEWSTHRDVMGACWPAWVDRERLARVFRVNPARLSERLHAYVSGDPSARVDGTPPPIKPESSYILAPPERLIVAAAFALRVPQAQAQGRYDCRRLALHLGRDLNVAGRDELRRLTYASNSTALRSFRESPPAEAVLAARRLLADPRMLSTTSPQNPDSEVEQAE